MGDQRVDDLWSTWAEMRCFPTLAGLAILAPSFDVAMYRRLPKSIADFVKRVFVSEMSTRHSVIMACVQYHGYTGAGNHKLIAERTSFTKMTGEIRPV